MKTNEIKKGMVVKLRNGWYGIMADNMKGNTRMVDVDGMFREIGSVYSHDITKVCSEVNYKLGTEIKGDNKSTAHLWASNVEHTPAQLKLKLMVDSCPF